MLLDEDVERLSCGGVALDPLLGRAHEEGKEPRGQPQEALDGVLGLRFLNLLFEFPGDRNVGLIDFFIEVVGVPGRVLGRSFQERLYHILLDHALREVDSSS